MKEYDHKKIERKWQTIWDKSAVYRAVSNSKKPKFYGLIEFPYPSGAGMHVGHIRSNTAMDIISRKRRMEGCNVLYPIGWDAFGLPTENYAIKTGIHPVKVTKDNTDTFRKQLKSLGFSFDWSREINTTDPKYYKWTQWIFLQLFKKGLAYKKKMEINWCPSCKIGLANEEVVDGLCERCGTAVEKREKEQWMLAITKYADRLDKDLDTVDYLEKIKIQQRNWIGKSEGAEIEFKIINPSLTLPEGKGKFGYHHTDPKTWRALQGRVVEMRKNSTEAEELFWKAVKGNKLNCHFRRQHIISRFVVDFVCLEKRLVVEVDGDIHDYQKKEDEERTQILQTLGFKILRFKNDNVLKDIDDVIEKIHKNLEALPFGEGQGGVELTYPLAPSRREEEFGEIFVKVFTTRPDTIFGATYLVLSPEHSLVEQITTKEQKNYVIDYITKSKTKSELERTTVEKEKTGVFTGTYAVNPATKEKIPVWIADYVLGTYGTGAIMAVPAHDERDFEFSQKYNLPIQQVVMPVQGLFVGPFTGNGVLINSGVFSSQDSEKAKKEIIKFVGGKEKTTYKLRDWVFSRQRYWGEPIPLIFCENCRCRTSTGWVPVPEKDLPVELPKVKNYQPTDTGESPLANISKWVNVKCPKCKSAAKRETDTMPNWAGSSWYYLRYVDPKNNKEFASKKNLEYWFAARDARGDSAKGGVDWYNGGMEHTTLHLLYSRFWHKFLYDLKLVPTSEPYMKRTSHGMILAEGGDKMSKSKGNVVNPDDLVKLYGADTLRMYEMFMGPFDQSVSWNTDGMVGPRRFLERVWNLQYKVQKNKKYNEFEIEKAVKKVTEDIETMKFNTAISTLMIFANQASKLDSLSQDVYEKLLKILSPFAPHIAEELWQILGHKKSINYELWPTYDVSKIQDDEIKIAVQVNGKVRAEIITRTDETEEDIKQKALNDEAILRHIEGREIKKVIYVKGRLINIVV